MEANRPINIDSVGYGERKYSMVINVSNNVIYRKNEI